MRLPALLPLLALLSGCGEVLFLEAETDQACLTLADLDLPAGDGRTRATLKTPLTYKLDPKALPGGEEGEREIRLTSVTFTAKSGGDLFFVENASVAALPPTGAPVPVVAYGRTGKAPLPTFRLVPTEAPDLTAYLQDETVILEAGLTGVSPTRPTRVDVTACFSALARVPYAR